MRTEREVLQVFENQNVRVRKFKRSLADAFADERAYCVEDKRGHRVVFHGAMKPKRKVVYLDNSFKARALRWVKRTWRSLWRST